jgi:hypothetical protein
MHRGAEFRDLGIGTRRAPVLVALCTESVAGMNNPG